MQNLSYENEFDLYEKEPACKAELIFIGGRKGRFS